MANLGRAWRTVRPLSPEQLGSRVLHEVRLRGAWRIPGVLAAQLRGRPSAVASKPLAVVPPAHPGAEERVRLYLAHGKVRAAGVVAPATAWDDPALSKLARYHLHYLELARDLAAEHEWDAALELVRRWWSEHPPRATEGWEPYPVASRAHNLAVLAARGRQVVPEWLGELISLHARYLEKWPETHLRANHLLKDRVALAMTGLVTEGPDSDRWRAIGLAETEHELARQLLPDGGHYERSPMYHLLALSDLLDLRLLCSARRRAPAWLEGAIERMAAFAFELRHPDGEIPLFNDAVIGQAPPPGYVLGRAGLAQGAPEGRIFEAASTGLTVVRSGGGEALFFDTGPLGPDDQPGHAHSDTLSYELSVAGRRVVVNGGMDGYQSRNRPWFRSALAHNTVTVGGEGPDELWGSFRVGARCRRTRSSIVEENGRVALDGGIVAHQGWEHVRTLLLSPGTALVVLDHVRNARGAEVVSRARLVRGCGLTFRPLVGEARCQPAPYAPEFGPTKTVDEHSVRGRGDDVRLGYVIAWGNAPLQAALGGLEGQWGMNGSEMW